MVQPTLQPSLPSFAIEPVLNSENCWTKAEANSLSVLIDAENYYLAFLSALQQAKRFVLILAWDIDTRVDLNPNASVRGKKMSLGLAFEEALTKNPELNIYILCWDFAMIYALERQILPQFRRSFKHPRIHFVLDDHHPFGACQHQKVVIIDDELAFLGGLDLCLRRWDTRKHRAFDRRRIDQNLRQYTPFHDVQVVLNGDAAFYLSLLAKDRWKRATGEDLPITFKDSGIWPKDVVPDFEQAMLGISRTYFSSKGSYTAREIEKLFVDSIAAAKEFVYIENQYFTSKVIAKAVSKRLQTSDCPEFLILIPRFNAGWLEESTMGVLRTRLVRDLLKEDRRQRLRFYYPVVHAKRTVPIYLHSKVMIVDDRILHVGSANLSNRSMGLDSECDIALEAESESTSSKAIARIRNSLVAEHLDTSISEIHHKILQTGSLFAVIDYFNQRPQARRTLVPFPTRLNKWIDYFTPDVAILDPDRPVDEDALYSYFLPKSRRLYQKLKYRKIKRRFAVALLVSLILWIAYLPLKPEAGGLYYEVQTYFNSLHPIVASVGILFVGNLILIPIDLMIFTVCFLATPWFGAIYSMIGILAAGLTSFSIGQVFRRVVDRGKQIQSDLPREHFGRFWAHFVMQLNLLAPFPSICFRAGRIRASLPVFISGVFFGQLLRVGLMSLYVSVFRVNIFHPSFWNFSMLLICSAFLFSLFRWSNHRFLPNFD